jgi:hypothetical protein
VNYAYAFLDKQHGGTEIVAKEGIQAFALLQGETLAASLQAAGVLTKEQVGQILEEAREAKVRRLAN